MYAWQLDGDSTNVWILTDLYEMDADARCASYIPTPAVLRSALTPGLVPL
jgi:hypothetical protein